MVRKVYYYAHRLSYLVHTGVIPDGLHVLHECDNPGCVNPKHLFLGTNLDNIEDKVAKGRQVGCKGQTSGKAKLTDEQVIDIRRRFTRVNHNVSNAKALSIEFGVSRTQILTIVNGQQWKHLAT